MDLKDKKILVVGLANRRSIAWGTIQSLRKRGAKVGICYFLKSNLKRVEPLAEEAEADFFLEVDATVKEDLEKLHTFLDEKWGTFDGLVHSVAFSPREELGCRFHECSKEGFFTTLDISAYSLIALVRHLKPLFNKDFSVISMTYYGSQKVLPGYNLMGVAKAALEAITRYLAEDLGRDGVRLNCISAGPIKTFASSGIPNFSQFLKEVEQFSPMKANISIEDVGELAAFLMSDSSKMLTGQTIFVDGGISIVAR